MHTLPPQTAGQLPFDRSWFLHVNELARGTPWLHAPARGYASYGAVAAGRMVPSPPGPGEAGRGARPHAAPGPRHRRPCHGDREHLTSSRTGGQGSFAVP